MSDTDKDKIKKLIEDKIKAEISKINEEKLKIQEERTILAKKTNSPWFTHQNWSWLIKSIIACVVIVPLVWFYIKEIIIPLQQWENIKFSQELQEMNAALENKSHDLDKIIKEKVTIEKKQIEIIDELEKERLKKVSELAIMKEKAKTWFEYFEKKKLQKEIQNLEEKTN